MIFLGIYFLTACFLIECILLQTVTHGHNGGRSYENGGGGVELFQHRSRKRSHNRPGEEESRKIRSKWWVQYIIMSWNILIVINLLKNGDLPGSYACAVFKGFATTIAKACPTALSYAYSELLHVCCLMFRMIFLRFSFNYKLRRFIFFVPEDVPKYICCFGWSYYYYY